VVHLAAGRFMQTILSILRAVARFFEDKLPRFNESGQNRGRFVIQGNNDPAHAGCYKSTVAADVNPLHLPFFAGRPLSAPCSGK